MFSSRKTAAPSTGYNLTKSLRFRSSASAYLNRTPGSAGNQKTWTWSGWVKRGLLGSADYEIFGANPSSASGDTTWTSILFSGDSLWVTGFNTVWRKTSQLFRDPSAWYHIIVTWDTTQATATDRIKIYVNGTQVTAFLTSNAPTLNTNYAINSAVAHVIGSRQTWASDSYFDGYMTEINFIDGQALTPSSFGSTNALTGVWQPAKYTGTYGTNGFYLPFTNTTSTTTLGYDSSGNSNNWTVNNISLTAGSTYDSMTDVPTLTSATVANYAVLNPLNKGSGTVIDGNLQNNGSGWSSSMTTISFAATGNYYCEMTGISVAGASQGVSVGILNPEYNLIGYADAIGNQPSGYGWYSYGGKTYNNGTGTTYNGSATYTTNDVLGIQLNNGTLTFYKNGTSQGTAYTGITGNYCFAVSCYGTDKIALNCGQRPFTYTPPTGSLALNTYNLPTSTIVKGASYMDINLYTGTSGSQSLTNAQAFQPSFIWLKSRSNATDHVVHDVLRGTAGIARLFPDSTAAESATGDGFLSINSNGFSLDSTGGGGDVNTTGRTYVAWQWAGPSSGTSNTSGSITSTVSVNATAGFSVVTWTGNGTNLAGVTIGHGLGVAPSMIIFRSRSSVSQWWVGHVGLGNMTTNFIQLNNTSAASSTANIWNSTAPTSTVFSTQNGYVGSTLTDTYVAYCWAPIAGYSAFGSYTGNGSADGPFVYTGFLPKFLLVKCSSGASTNWVMYDSTRNPYNGVTYQLYPSGTYAEGVDSNGPPFFLSNGFKMANASSATLNTSGQTYIYAAFASNPFKNSNAF